MRVLEALGNSTQTSAASCGERSVSLGEALAERFSGTEFYRNLLTCVRHVILLCHFAAQIGNRLIKPANNRTINFD